MSRFREIPIDVSFPQLEREVLERWTREHTFERSIEKRKDGPAYVFYDGPPFATGMPHYGHILTSYIKDVVPRYFTMRGYHVPRRWGWDCHGLPVEFEIEKKLGLKTRSEIVEFGIGKFNQACKDSVLQFADEWRTIIGRLGRWVDFDDDYKTMDPSYMESVVWVWKTLYDKGLIYEGNKVVPYCTRCQTTLSNFEARLDDAFRPRQDPALTVRFRGRDQSNESFLAWTTTPWTLPSNVALAVGENIDYVRMEKDGDHVWLAAAALPRYERELAGYVEQERVTGESLVGRRFVPLLPYFQDLPNAFTILAGDFVTTEDGTGIVHMAPSFGEDDNALCNANGIAGPNPVADDGTFDSSVSDFQGQHVFAANPHIAQKLKEQQSVFRRETYDHNYPHCWRCDSPLIYRAIKTWFVKVSDFKARMIAANKKIRWVPEHIRDGRFGNWLENAHDWAISRNRFWGAPIPVWRCANCKSIEVIGGRAELEKKSGRTVEDWHRPAIDEITFACSCGGTMTRVPDVLDCWFESGSMPYAQVHYPFERKAEFEANFPGDFIVEYVAQTRGWFYTLVVLSAALFDERPFKDVVCHGVILAEDGRKMSKRLKNYPDPMELVEKHGSDALRVALLSSPVVGGADVRFAEASVRDAVRRICIPLWNSLHYFTAYASIDQFEPDPRFAFPNPTQLDRYLLSETEGLRVSVEEAMAAYDFEGGYQRIEAFITMLSTWYIRLSKQRLWRAGVDDDKRHAYHALYLALSTVAKVSAPFLPFLAESLHAALGEKESVHLADWPKPTPWRNVEISTEMSSLREVVRLARSIREEHKLKHRHPLPSVAIAGVPAHAIQENLELLREELNVKSVEAIDHPESLVARVAKLDYTRLGKRLRGDVKKVQAAIDSGNYQLTDGKLIAAGHTIETGDYSFRFVPKEAGKGVAAEEKLVVVLDLTSDPKLIAEGQMRDLNRGVQDLRKKAGLAYADRVDLSVVASDALHAILDEHKGWLAEQTLAKTIARAALVDPLAIEEIEVGDEKVTIALRRAA
jgi:isoleucyl-tRNA synthetase